MAKSIKLDSPYYWSSRGIWHEEMILKNYLDTLSTNIKTNTSNITTINTNNLLWSGAIYMNGSQVVELSAKISEQTNGVVLVFSAYENGTSKNWDWNTVFVPKQLVSLQPGNGYDIKLNTPTYGHIDAKYLYVSDDHITGHDNNTASGSNNGVTYNNKYWVLRYVIGV